MLNVSELRNLAVDELLEKVNGLKKELMQYRFQAKTGKLERQSALKEVRRDIARLLTVVSEKNNEEAGRAPKKPAPKKEVAVKKEPAAKKASAPKKEAKAAVKPVKAKKEVKKKS